jgi:trimethylamine---corrinoid protein Co-methyltransferase
MIALTDELVAMADHMMKGIEVNEQTTLLDELHRVGPGGQFISTEATYQGYRDFWFPSVADRSIRRKWLAAGGTTMGQRLNARVKDIIRDHRLRPLAPEKAARLRQILAGIGAEAVLA